MGAKHIDKCGDLEASLEQAIETFDAKKIDLEHCRRKNALAMLQKQKADLENQIATLKRDSTEKKRQIEYNNKIINALKRQVALMENSLSKK